MKRFLLTACATLGLATAAMAGSTTGELQVVDGDTLSLGGSVRIRLWGIDAPETDQGCLNANGAAYQCGEQAKLFLAGLIGNNAAVDCKTIDKDKYGRYVAKCTVRGQDIGAAMVQAGWAFDYTQYSKGAYAREESAAQAAGRGVWQGTAQRPWDWRHRFKA